MSVQLENGYTRIANELLGHLVYDTKVSVGELKLLIFVMRKTYGFCKKTDRISLSQFTRGIRYDRSNICRMIRSLVAKRLLDKLGSIYKINKNWQEWVVAKQPLGSGNSVNRVVAKQPHTKETITKEILLRSAKTPHANKNMRYEYSADWGKEKKSDPLKGEIDRILGAFDTQYKKDIGRRMFPMNIPLARKSVKNALKTYKENEIVELMPVFFSNEFYRNSGWAVWTMMSPKVLNSLKNG